MSHGDLHLVRERQLEERGAGRSQPGQQVRRDAVAGDVEEAVLTARRFDLPGHLSRPGGPRPDEASRPQRRHVNDRKGTERMGNGHDSILPAPAGRLPAGSRSAS